MHIKFQLTIIKVVFGFLSKKFQLKVYPIVED